MGKRRIIQLIIVMVLAVIILITFITINSVNEKPRKSAIADILNVFIEFDSAANIQPLTYAGRSESVPFAYDYNWDIIELSTDEVLIYYCESSNEANRLYDKCSLSNESCWVIHNFIVYYKGSNDKLLSFIRKTSSNQ